MRILARFRAVIEPLLGFESIQGDLRHFPKSYIHTGKFLRMSRIMKSVCRQPEFVSSDFRGFHPPIAHVWQISVSIFRDQGSPQGSDHRREVERILAAGCHRTQDQPGGRVPSLRRQRGALK